MPMLRIVLLSLILAAIWAPAPAQDVGIALYRGEARAASQSEADQGPALRAALMQVLTKLTGLPDALQQPGVAEALARAPELVASTRYRQQLEGQDYQDYLVVDFQPESVDALIQELGLIAWPEPRPTPVLWLAIDDGRGPRLVTAAQGAVVASLRAQGAERGVRFALPEGGPGDENFGLQAAWRDDAEAAEALLSRYPGGVQLLGRVFRSDGGWAAEWSLREHGALLDRWTNAGPDARDLMASAGSTTVDLLAGRFASLVGAGPPGVFQVQVEGLTSAEHYPTLMAYLGNLGPVRRATPLAAGAESLTLELDLAIGLEGFGKLVETGPVLRAVEISEQRRLFRLLP